MLRHSELLRPLVGWTIRVLVPAPFTKAIRMFGHAAREELATPIENGANLNALKDGKTRLDHALAQGLTDFAAALRARGARTAMELADAP